MGKLTGGINAVRNSTFQKIQKEKGNEEPLLAPRGYISDKVRVGRGV